MSIFNEGNLNNFSVRGWHFSQEKVNEAVTEVSYFNMLSIYTRLLLSRMKPDEILIRCNIARL